MSKISNDPQALADEIIRVSKLENERKSSKETLNILTNYLKICPHFKPVNIERRNQDIFYKIIKSLKYEYYAKGDIIYDHMEVEQKPMFIYIILKGTLCSIQPNFIQNKSSEQLEQKDQNSELNICNEQSKNNNDQQQMQFTNQEKKKWKNILQQFKSQNMVEKYFEIVKQISFQYFYDTDYSNTFHQINQKYQQLKKTSQEEKQDFQIQYILQQLHTFGESSNLNQDYETNNASVIALENTHLISIHRGAYNKALKPITTKIDFLQKIFQTPIFKEVQEEKIPLNTLICNNFQLIQGQKGDQIYSQNDTINYFYIVKEGNLEIRRYVQKSHKINHNQQQQQNNQNSNNSNNNHNNLYKIVQIFQPGDFFGHEELSQNLTENMSDFFKNNISPKYQNQKQQYIMSAVAQSNFTIYQINLQLLLGFNQKLYHCIKQHGLAKIGIQNEKFHILTSMMGETNKQSQQKKIGQNTKNSQNFRRLSENFKMSNSPAFSNKSSRINKTESDDIQYNISNFKQINLKSQNYNNNILDLKQQQQSNNNNFYDLNHHLQIKSNHDLVDSRESSHESQKQVFNSINFSKIQDKKWLKQQKLQQENININTNYPIFPETERNFRNQQLKLSKNQLTDRNFNKKIGFKVKLDNKLSKDNNNYDENGKLKCIISNFIDQKKQVQNIKDFKNKQQQKNNNNKSMFIDSPRKNIKINHKQIVSSNDIEYIESTSTNNNSSSGGENNINSNNNSGGNKGEGAGRNFFQPITHLRKSTNLNVKKQNKNFKNINKQLENIDINLVNTDSETNVDSVNSNSKKINSNNYFNNVASINSNNNNICVNTDIASNSWEINLNDTNSYQNNDNNISGNQNQAIQQQNQKSKIEYSYFSPQKKPNLSQYKNANINNINNNQLQQNNQYYNVGLFKGSPLNNCNNKNNLIQKKQSFSLSNFSQIQHQKQQQQQQKQNQQQFQSSQNLNDSNNFIQKRVNTELSSSINFEIKSNYLDASAYLKKQQNQDFNSPQKNIDQKSVRFKIDNEIIDSHIQTPTKNQDKQNDNNNNQKIKRQSQQQQIQQQQKNKKNSSQQQQQKQYHPQDNTFIYIDEKPLSILKNFVVDMNENTIQEKVEQIQQQLDKPPSRSSFSAFFNKQEEMEKIDNMGGEVGKKNNLICSNFQLRKKNRKNSTLCKKNQQDDVLQIKSQQSNI